MDTFSIIMLIIFISIFVLGFGLFVWAIIRIGDIEDEE